MASGVYEIVCVPTGKRYVGSAINLAGRWSGHRSRLSKQKHHNARLQNAWNKHGEACFSFRPLLICSKDRVIFYEQRAIDVLRPEFNLARVAGSSLGRRLTDETRQKIAAKALGRKRDPESVERGAAKRRGVPLSPEHRATLLGNKHAAGLRHTDEWKAATSARQRGVARPRSAEHTEKLAAALTGRKQSTEHIANSANARRGVKRGPYRKRARAPLS